jgi:hypothetical protein
LHHSQHLCARCHSRLAEVEKISDEFALTVIPDGGVRRCAVVWRKEGRLAVAFF